ncbi:unnamed protein product [Spodoptera littoralis]|uniref:Uncharacterized protein n=1 Tax=Spodoptera littoralis TaxID=7109 RepID=A0A9P0IAM2_SPOLI|nr:unnamed protein product [Spodoptera littoralis]CAH1643210.1 unnamed protein product [Spodoptera littoralis]
MRCGSPGGWGSFQFRVLENLDLKDSIPWSILRVHYSNLVKLVKEIDDNISSLILLSFFTDLFYICLQLFNSLQALSSPFYLLYYLYSFVFLVLRALMLSLFASNVHCAALEPVYSVYDVPSSVYDNEMGPRVRRVGTLGAHPVVSGKTVAQWSRAAVHSKA